MRPLMGWTAPASDRLRLRVAVAEPLQRGAVEMQVATIGFDLAKHVFQVHGVDVAGSVVVRKRLRRSEVAAFFAGLEPCLVGMEACSCRSLYLI
jgi:hypothetical protein